MDATLFENVCRDQRQVVNGLSELGGYVSCSVGYEADSGDGGRNLQHAIGRTGIFAVPMAEEHRILLHEHCVRASVQLEKMQ